MNCEINNLTKRPIQMQLLAITPMLIVLAFFVFKNFHINMIHISTRSKPKVVQKCSQWRSPSTKPTICDFAQ